MHIKQKLNWIVFFFKNTILHFHTDFLRILQFQLLSLSRQLAETVFISFPVPLNHFSTMMYGGISTDCGTPKKSHPYTYKQNTNTHTKDKKYTGVFQHSVPGWGLLPWRSFLCKSPCKSTVGLHLPTEVWRDDLVFALLARGSVSVMAKHSSASRHRWGFLQAQIQFCPRWLLRQCWKLLTFSREERSPSAKDPDNVFHGKSAFTILYVASPESETWLAMRRLSWKHLIRSENSFH